MSNTIIDAKNTPEGNYLYSQDTGWFKIDKLKYYHAPTNTLVFIKDGINKRQKSAINLVNIESKLNNSVPKKTLLDKAMLKEHYGLGRRAKLDQEIEHRYYVGHYNGKPLYDVPLD